MDKQQKKKVIYVVTKGNWGGAQKYVFDLATSLASESRWASLPQDKFDVLVIHGQGNILNKRLQKSGVETLLIPEMGRDINIFREIIILFKIFKIFFDEKPDVVHINSSKAGGIGAFIARLTRTPKIIFTVHGWAFNEEHFDNLLTKFFSWLTVLLSTKTIVISKENLRQGLRFPFVKNRFVLIYNGIKEINFRDKDSSRKFIAGITKAPIQKPWIVTISELHKNKGLEYLIKSVRQMKERPVVFIIGEGEERNNLEKLIENFGLQENFYLMGFMENASSYLKAFDIFTLTSTKEGHPYTILEAGLAKLPVVGSDIPGITDIIENNENGILVEPRNSDDIKKALEELLLNSKKMAQLGDNLENSVRDKFSFEKMLKETIALY